MGDTGLIGSLRSVVFHGGMRTLLLSVLLLSVIPLRAFAAPVISEVMWMGTSLSSSDEWLEIMNPDATDADLSGWSVTSVNSSGKETVLFRFETGSVISAGQYLVIASKSAASSRLLQEPFGVSSGLSLPNTKLFVRLRDASGAVVDQVDDGVGAPFAGDNPSGTGAKASMERVDTASSGSLKENWRSATLSLGFDPDAGDFGTPGFESKIEEEPQPDPEPEPDPEPDPDPAPCEDPLEIAIAVQSGPLVAVGKATVNFQAVATEGSLAGVICSWIFTDGFASQSCNPPVHSFVTPGTNIVRLEAKNKCGNTLTQEQIVEVKPDPAAASTSSTQAVWYDGSRLILMAALPNPEGTDTGKEWIEIKNPEDKPVDLRGWKIKVGETTVKTYALKNVIGPGETLKIYNSELSFTLPNSASKISLITPSDLILSTIPWTGQAEEGRRYFPDDIRNITIRGTVVSVTDSTSFVLELHGEASAILGRETLSVRLSGLYPRDEVKGYDFLRALIKNEKVELLCSTDMWEADGAIRADALLQDNTTVTQRLAHLDYWTSDLALYENEKVVSKMYAITGSVVAFDAASLRLMEIYPSPFPKTSPSVTEDWEAKEWLEIENTEQRAVDLTGWKIKTGKSVKPLPLGLKVASGSRVIIDASSLKLTLRNAGDTVSLVSPNDSVISSLSYPKLKNGMAYALIGDGFCETIQPTPGIPNVCTSAPAKISKATVKKQKALSTPKASARVRAYAASYRAQHGDKTVSSGEIIAPEFDATSSAMPITMGAFLAGSGLPVLLFFLYGKASRAREWLTSLRSSETA